VHTDGVDVLDGTHHDGVVRRVAHELELVLLPPEDRLLEEDLARRALVDAVADDPPQLLLGVGEARAEAAHREGGAHDERVAEVLCVGHRLLDGVRDVGPGDVRSGVEHELLEDLAVLALVDRLEVRTDELDVVLLEDAVLVQLDGGVEGRLPAERREDGVGALLGDDRLDHLPRDGLDVGRVGEVRVRHDRRRVRVHEDDAHALLTQHAAGLGPRVVELDGLADDDRAGADDEDAVDVVALGH
jgi:hypothetical protein